MEVVIKAVPTLLALKHVLVNQDSFLTLMTTIAQVLYN